MWSLRMNRGREQFSSSVGLKIILGHCLKSEKIVAKSQNNIDLKAFTEKHTIELLPSIQMYKLQTIWKHLCSARTPFTGEFFTPSGSSCWLVQIIPRKSNRNGLGMWREIHRCSFDSCESQKPV